MENLQEFISSLKDKQGIAKSWKNSLNILEEESFVSYHDKIQALSRGFLELGIMKGDHVAYLADNNPDWIAISLALSNIGAVDVPRASDTRNHELEYILNHSDSSRLIVKNDNTLNRIKNILPKEIKEIITLDNSKGGIPIKEILHEGLISSKKLPEVSGDDLSGIIYTSGTTGNPKGVMLSHLNLISNFSALTIFEDMQSTDIWFTPLPPWHGFQRGGEYCALHSGARMHHASIYDIPQVLTEIKPTVFITVPRILESAYEKSMKNLEMTINDMTGLKKLFMLSLYPRVIPGLIFPDEMKKRIHAALGGNVRLMVTGGASLALYLEDFNRKAKLPIVNGYGMTETSPVISANLISDGKNSKHTVGRIMPNIKVKIADPDTNHPVYGWGEVQVSGPSVMKGYYKDPDSTKKVIYIDNEGNTWFKTGDRGKFIKNKYLKLNGRYTNTIIFSNGENIDPESLENILNKNQFIKSSLVFKHKKSSILLALALPDFNTLKDYCNKHNIDYDENNLTAVLENPEIKSLYNSVLKQYNSSVNRSHMISKLSLLDRAFDIGVEITDTLKLRRKEILENRKYNVDSLLDNK